MFKEKKVNKEAIAVYNPQNSLEREIQKSHHKYNPEMPWLNSYECQLATRAIASLKIKGEWIYEEELYSVRADHFFAPEMIEAENNEFVFPTHLLFLRDIFENKKISAKLNDPIVFVTSPIAHFLLVEYPVHLIININQVKDRPIAIGGMRIFEDSVELEDGFVADIRINDNANKKYLLNEIDKIISDNDFVLRKAASTKGKDEILRMDEDQLFARSNGWVQNKITKKMGKVDTIEPGPAGKVIVQYNDGEIANLTKEEFVLGFIYGV